MPNQQFEKIFVCLYTLILEKTGQCLHREHSSALYPLTFCSLFVKQGEPDVRRHSSLLCAAGAGGRVRGQRRACSTGGGDGNGKDVHGSAPGQSHR